ncbi:MAG TPA: Dabb family protein [Vicinamibacterales bacterium]|jgi:hypothetical protein|nr:Dabb family protein [Vicinamibacterales bacterium]
MVTHLVLFRLRPDVSVTERRALLDTWETALRDIPSIRRATVGRRIRIGRPYEQLTHTDFPYAAILEFDDPDGLRAYLDHPAHEPIATRFFAALADTQIYDFDVDESVEGLRGMLEPGVC